MLRKANIPWRAVEVTVAFAYQLFAQAYWARVFPGAIQQWKALRQGGTFFPPFVTSSCGVTDGGAAPSSLMEAAGGHPGCCMMRQPRVFAGASVKADNITLVAGQPARPRQIAGHTPACSRHTPDNPRGATSGDCANSTWRAGDESGLLPSAPNKATGTTKPASCIRLSRKLDSRPTSFQPHGDEGPMPVLHTNEAPVRVEMKQFVGTGRLSFHLTRGYPPEVRGGTRARAEHGGSRPPER